MKNLESIDKLIDRHVMPEPTSGCWLWIGARFKDRAKRDDGYGKLRRGHGEGRWLTAHRLIWENRNGPVPEGMELDHLCRVKCCVNPAHLEPVTHVENMRRSPVSGANLAQYQKAKGARTHCNYGHLYDAVYVRPSGYRERICTECRRDGVTRWKARHAR